jgi:hypothetical protein
MGIMGQRSAAANGYAEASGLGDLGLQLILPLIELRSNGRMVTTSKGTMARELQRTVGDVLFNRSDGRVYGVEVKTERQDSHGNFFFEYWSNKGLAEDGSPLLTHGWLHTLRTDLLFYLFYEDRRLYIMNFQKLQKWAFFENKIYAYPEKRQNAYQQRNVTWGRVVPIAHVARDVGCAVYDCRNGFRRIEVTTTGDSVAPYRWERKNKAEGISPPCPA